MSIHVASTLSPSLDHECLCKFVFLRTPPNYTNEIQLQLINLIFRYYNEHLIFKMLPWSIFQMDCLQTVYPFYEFVHP